MLGNTRSDEYSVDALTQTYYLSGKVTRFGTACRGPNGTPTYILPDDTKVLPGGELKNRLTNASPGAVALHIFGDSTSKWGNLTLPFRSESRAISTTCSPTASAGM